MKKTIQLGLTMLILLSACRDNKGVITGNGIHKTEYRKVTGFTGINVKGFPDSVILQQDSFFLVKVEVDENLLPYLMTENKDGILTIYQKENTTISIGGNNVIKVFISAPVFRHLETSSPCTIYSKNTLSAADSVTIKMNGYNGMNLTLSAQDVKADLTGDAIIFLQGKTKNLAVNASGLANVFLYNLLSDNTKLNLSGAGDIQVSAKSKLDIKLSGSSEVLYRGDPVVTQNISGSGSIRKAD